MPRHRGSRSLPSIRLWRISTEVPVIGAARLIDPFRSWPGSSASDCTRTCIRPNSGTAQTATGRTPLAAGAGAGQGAFAASPAD